MSDFNFQKPSLSLRFYPVLVVLLITCVVYNQALAQKPNYDAKTTYLLKKVATYLNTIKTARASFQQQVKGGETSVGIFEISRPGKMRLQYTKPDITVSIRGDDLVYYDAELDSLSYISSQDVPITFLLDDPIDLFRQDLDVKAGYDKEGNIVITVRQTRADGQVFAPISFVFQKEPLKLLYWAFYDQQERLTVVKLTSLETRVEFPAKHFIFKNPRFDIQGGAASRRYR
jgi:outer membrane lipoprotein-sorting protein